MNKPLFSVVIIAYNAADTITKSIDSLLNQTNCDPKKNIELIIVDDKSTDNQKEVCDKYKNKFNRYVYHVLRENNHKLGALRYTGTGLATGEWITYLDADDIFLENAFEIITNIIDSELCNESTPAVWAHEYYKAYTIDNSMADNFSNGHLHGKFYKLSFMQEYDINFDPNMTFEEDLYFNMIFTRRLKFNKISYIECKTPIYVYEGNPNSICKREIERSIKDGILYPDHHLVHFDDYIEAGGSMLLEYLEKAIEINDEDLIVTFTLDIYGIILGYYLAINHYYYISTQFPKDKITNEYTEYLSKAKLCIIKFVKTLPASITPYNIEQFAYNNPDIILSSLALLDCCYRPGEYVYKALPVQSIHEFLNEIFIGY